LKGREILGLPVWYPGGGREAGRIVDLLFDPHTGKVEALILEGELEGAVPFKSLAWRDPAGFEIQESPPSGDPPSGLKSWREVKGCSLWGQGHSLEDFIVDPSTGDITSLEVSEGIIDDLIHGRQQVPLREISLEELLNFRKGVRENDEALSPLWQQSHRQDRQ